MRGDVVSRCDQFAQQGSLANDIRIGNDIRSTGCFLHQRAEVTETTGIR